MVRSAGTLGGRAGRPPKAPQQAWGGNLCASAISFGFWQERGVPALPAYSARRASRSSQASKCEHS